MTAIILAGLAALFTGVAFILQRRLMTGFLFLVMIMGLFTTLMSSQALKIIFGIVEAALSTALLYLALKRKRT